MSKKTQIAKLIRAMTQKERLAMASDFTDMQYTAADDGSKWNMTNKRQFALMLRVWADGLGSME